MRDGKDRSHIDVASSGLATERSRKGQGTVRRHSAGTKIVDQPKQGRHVESWRGGNGAGSSCGACVTTGSARELPHRFNRYAAPQGERRAAQATRGDRKWLECAKGGQPEKVSGG